MFMNWDAAWRSETNEPVPHPESHTEAHEIQTETEK
jgi:hypothetical protein